MLTRMLIYPLFFLFVCYHCIFIFLYLYIFCQYKVEIEKNVQYQIITNSHIKYVHFYVTFKNSLLTSMKQIWVILRIISVCYSRNIYLKTIFICKLSVLPTTLITNALVLSIYFCNLTFCFTTVIPFLIIFLTCTSVWPFNIIAVLGAGTKYHTLIDVC